jgi:hypothetical protein
LRVLRHRAFQNQHLPAATIGKLNGKVRKIVPIKIEDCGDLPPTLASLCWEDFSTRFYGLALERVLHSIFDVDVRPPIGIRAATAKPNPPQPPESAQAKETPSTQFPIDMFHVDAFAQQLSSEGFDARGNLFNGTVGVIVGPKGSRSEANAARGSGIVLSVMGTQPPV